MVADMVTKPEEYKWSSCRTNAWGRESSLIPHAEYLKLGADIESRGFAYHELFKHHISSEDIHTIEKAAEYCQPVGDDRFRLQIESKCGIKLGYDGRGRPRNTDEKPVKF